MLQRAIDSLFSSQIIILVIFGSLVTQLLAIDMLEYFKCRQDQLLKIQKQRLQYFWALYMNSYSFRYLHRVTLNGKQYSHFFQSLSYYIVTVMVFFFFFFPLKKRNNKQKPHDLRAYNSKELSKSYISSCQEHRNKNRILLNAIPVSLCCEKE